MSPDEPSLDRRGHDQELRGRRAHQLVHRIAVKRNDSRENTDGIDLQAGSGGNTIKHNAFRDNRSRGIMIRGNSTDHVIKENTFTGNRVGILVFGGVDTTVKDNLVSAASRRHSYQRPRDREPHHENTVTRILPASSSS